ncbi:unnamed protein product, partial [Prorocentrum cordatum]
VCDIVEYDQRGLTMSSWDSSTETYNLLGSNFELSVVMTTEVGHDAFHDVAKYVHMFVLQNIDINFEEGCCWGFVFPGDREYSLGYRWLITHQAWNRLQHALHGNGPDLGAKVALRKRLAKLANTPAMMASRVMTVLEMKDMPQAQKTYDHLRNVSKERMAEISRMEADKIFPEITKWLKERPIGSTPPAADKEPKKKKLKKKKTTTATTPPSWQLMTKLDDADWSLPTTRGLPQQYDDMKRIHLVTVSEMSQLVADKDFWNK